MNAIHTSGAVSPWFSTILATGLTLIPIGLTVRAGEPSRLLKQPTLSRDHIAFEFAGDLWAVSRSGGEARRLTSNPGIEKSPIFSPDGAWIAFTGEYDGNRDVYLIPSGGGVPKRLTYHPGDDTMAGWTPDGKRVVLASSRNSAFYNNRLFTLPLEGGFETELPLPYAEAGSYAGDGKRLAYVPTMQWQAAWKRYRGGQTRPIWIADLNDSSIVKVPRENSNDFNPMWIGETVYFLSDRTGPVSLFAYDVPSGRVRRVLENKGLDFKSAGAGPGGIVIEQFGQLLLYDLKSGQAQTVPVTVTSDFAEVRPKFKKVEGKDLDAGRPSPGGHRVVFETRGEILTVPAEKGDVRNLTQTPNVAERDAAWSPDGRSIAYFSEVSGEYALHVRNQDGQGEIRKFDLGHPPSFFYEPTWSPDGKKLTYSDKRGRLWMLDLAEGKPVTIDTNTFGVRMDSNAWSPDSRWIAYTKILPNRLGALFVHEVTNHQNRQVTDGLSDVSSPTFDASGKYLYFAASTDSGAANSWGNLSSINRPMTRSLYLAVLDKTQPSPLAPQSDEEKPDKKEDKPGEKPDPKVETKSDDTKGTDKVQATETPKGKAADKGSKTKASARKKKDAAKAEQAKDTNAPPKVTIDFENLSQRVLAIPMPARNYRDVIAGKTNFLFAVEAPEIERFGDDPTELVLHRFDFAKRKSEKFLEGIRRVALSANREKLLYRKGDNWFLVGVEQLPKGDEKPIPLSAVDLAVEPRVEWRQMYQEVWRIERDWLYDPGHHGLDLAATSQRYESFLDGLANRADLNYLFEEMLGELSLGHVFVGGGDQPEVPKVKVGLLGVNVTVENGRYRFARIFNGENWNPKLRAPLTEPGVNVVVGEYLLAVDGRDVQGTENLYSFFQNKADKLVRLRVGPNADGTGAREVEVKPVDNEQPLRNRAWIEDNRRKVTEQSGGRLAYVYLPDTHKGGYDSFNRYFFAQVDKDGFIIDERFNGGGWLADYVVDYLRRPVMNYSMTREGAEMSFPAGASAGPKVMIINEFAGSGGDALPWYFRKSGIGPLVGKRTWGGLVGIGGYPSLLDGGFVMAPHWAIYGTDGEWEVENVGIAPDVEVELDPKAWRQGHDLQLEKAVELAMESLKKNPPQKPRRPAFPNYHKAVGSGPDPVR